MGLMAAAFAMLEPSPLSAQSIWPERAENLQELPADFPAQRLRTVMQGFSRSLGVRCAHCHVGQEGQPLNTYDFVSDENPNKDRARAMLRMLGDINRHLEAIEPSGPERVNMWCNTCHQGKPRPQTLEEAVLEARTLADADPSGAAVGRFLELRESYFGGNQYDFQPASVNTLGSRLLQEGDTVAAVRVLELNVEHHPEWAPGFESLGDVASLRGDTDRAVRFYEAALELDPENPRFQRKLAGAMERRDTHGAAAVSDR